jgi:hypothetical protein
VIVAVEGPSAAGKTTWCRRHVQRFVAEYTPTGNEPDGSDLSVQGRYWTQVNSGRWSEALRMEAQGMVAVCDSDPLKLHYSWCLSMIGAAPRERFDCELTYVRQAFEAGRLGLADVVLLSFPSLPVLRTRQQGDSTRRRRSFELHARLHEPLVAWYQAVDDLAPGRILWELPPDGLPLPLPAPRPCRTDMHLLDALVTSLPAP